MVSPLQIYNPSVLGTPERWFGLSQLEVLKMCSVLVRPSKRVDVTDAREPSRYTQMLQELAISRNSVDMHVTLFKKLKPSLSFSEEVTPLGPAAPLKHALLQENPKANRLIEKAYYDTDLSAGEALLELYRKGIPLSSLSKALAAGCLGVKKRRRLVPTRWAITAVDGQLGELLIERVKRLPVIEYFELYESHYLDNHFFVVLMPTSWAFEQLECWLPSSAWMPGSKAQIIADHEFYQGRKDYASNVEGAYYAARFAVAEHLVVRGEQAACVVLREIGPEYKIPLGVWQIRENVRHALQSRCRIFETLDGALQHIKSKLKVDITCYLSNSVVLEHFKGQKKLSAWM
jgi:hypothetical protein